MVDGTVNIETALNENSSSSQPKKREKSLIDFPYHDLDDGISVARSLNEFAGNQVCNVSELAAHMGMEVTGGGFRTKIAAARSFGLAKSEQRGRINITNLGSRILKTESEKDARAEAFLSVELYLKVYESRQGHEIPQAAVLERQFVELGVPKKQKAKARQAFERSVHQAGFINSSGRLVRPSATKLPGLSEKKEKDFDQLNEKKVNGSGGDGGGTGFNILHPFIKGLLETIPEPGTDWPYSKRKDWLKTAEQIFKLIYKSSETEENAGSMQSH